MIKNLVVSPARIARLRRRAQIVLALAGCTVAGCGVAQAQVAVAQLAGGTRELASRGKHGLQVLHLDAKGSLKYWQGASGGVSLAALEVLDAGGKVIFPGDAATLKMDGAPEGASKQEAVVSLPDGMKLIYSVEPERLGLRVEGAGASYTVRLRAPARLEGSRIIAPDGVKWVSAGAGAVAGSPQTLATAGASSALAIAGAASINWWFQQTDNWTWLPTQVGADIALKAGQQIWLSAADAPRAEGAVQFGLSVRRNFLPFEAPVVATLSTTRLSAQTPVTLSLSRAPGEVVAGGVLLAALVPLASGDPIDASEQTPWHSRYDYFAYQLLPVKLEAGGDKTWKLSLAGAQPPGVYRLRVWVAPADAPRPEALGGPKGAVAPYFPGFSGRGISISQAGFAGDAFVLLGETAPSSLTVVNPTRRTAFWRGENIALLVQARAPAATKTLTARLAILSSDGAALATQNLPIALTGGFGVSEVLLSSKNLAPGSYSASATSGTAGAATYPFVFTIAPPPAGGMAVINSPGYGPRNLTAVERLGVNVWSTPLGEAGQPYAPTWPAGAGTAGVFAGEPWLPVAPPAGASLLDALTTRNWLWQQGVQTRQISFTLQHSIAEQVAENQRKHLIYAQLNRRSPSMLGLIFDYDNVGTKFGGPRRDALLSARWAEYWAKAKAAGVRDDEQMRYLTMFHSGVIADLYQRSEENLRRAVPEQRHTTAATADHAEIEYGKYLPEVYRPLDYRYLEAWNDQIYPNSGHDMQESFWTLLLNMEKPEGQPLWVTAPTAEQPGTHLRRSLEEISHGATGVGYGFEGGVGLEGGWGPLATTSDLRTVQETQTGALARKYGAWLRAFKPDAKVAVLYSASQGGSNFGSGSPVFFTMFVLEQNGRAATLLSEKQIAEGALSGLQALVLARQSAALPPETTRAIEAFAARGGKVLSDNDTTIAIKGMTKVPALALPAGVQWFLRGNNYHGYLMSLARSIGGPLRAALGEAGRAPLEAPIAENGTAAALVGVARAGDAQLVFVTNNNVYPFDSLFNDEQKKSVFWRFHGAGRHVFSKDVRLPQNVTLRLRPDLVAKAPVITDVFAGKTLPIKGGAVTVDLTTMAGRVLLLSPAPLSAPQLYAAKRAATDPLATLVVKSAVPLPIRLRVGGQTIYRAATAAGSLDTFALGPKAGDTAVEITDLISGKTWKSTLSLAAAVAPKTGVLPAVQVWDEKQVAEVLKAPRLAIYVDARQAHLLEAARAFAKSLPDAEVVFNPPARDYPVSWDSWDSPAEEEAVKQKILKDGLPAWRHAPAGIQWTGTLRPSVVWNRPVVLLGTAQDNRLIEDLNGITLLARPSQPDMVGPGRAFVQPVFAPFWNGQNAVVALCSDEAGVEAALAELQKIAGGQAKPGSLRLSDDGGAREERRRAVGFDAQNRPAVAALAPLAVTSANAPAGVAGMEGILPVSGLVPVGNGVLATLHTTGRNLVRVNDKGAVAWRTATSGFYQPLGVAANERGESVSWDGTFVWRHDASGKVLWKMQGGPFGSPAADGSELVGDAAGLRRVAPDGAIGEALKLGGSPVGLSPDGAVIYVSRAGTEANNSRLTTSLAAVEVASGRELWSVPQLQTVQMAGSADGKTLAVIENENFAGRDDIGASDASRVAVIEAATGKVLMRRSMAQGLSDLAISSDGSRVIAGAAGVTNVIYVFDTKTDVVRRLLLPETGSWARAISPDGKTAWVAGDITLYRVDLDSLKTTAVLAERVVQLLPRGDGVWAGTATGRVLQLDAGGKTVSTLDLTEGLALDDVEKSMQSLREAKLVASPQLRAHEVGETVLAGPEALFEFMARGTSVALRNDGLQPFEMTVHIKEAGRYRFVIALDNPPDQTAQMGAMTVTTDYEAASRLTAQAVNGDIRRQAVESDLKPGVHVFQIGPNGWPVEPILKSVTVEKAD